MRKMFTKLFGLTLLMFLFSVAAKAQVPPTDCGQTITAANVELVTPLADVCDSSNVTFKVVGDFADTTYYAFNHDGNVDGGFTDVNTVTVKEGNPVWIQVMEIVNGDTCASNNFEFMTNVVDSIAIGVSTTENPTCGNDLGEVTAVFTGGYVAEYLEESGIEFPYLYSFVPKSVWDANGGPGYYEDYTDVSPNYATGPDTFLVAVFENKDTADICLTDFTMISAWDTAVVESTTPPVEVDTIFGTDALCPGNGTVTAVAAEGTPFSWGYLASLHDADDLSVIAADTTVNDTVVFANVAAGEYVVRFQDSIGCFVISDSTATIVSPEKPIVDVAIKSVDCFGGENGAITVFLDTNFVGFTSGNYEALIVSLDTMVDDSVYSWVPMTNDTAVIDGLSPIYYSAFVRDAVSGCDSVPYWNPNLSGNFITLQTPGEIGFDVVYENGMDSIPCYGDSMYVKVENFTGGSGNYEIQFEDMSSGIVTAWSDTAMWTVAVGDYIVSVRDADLGDAGCGSDSLLTITGNAPITYMEINDEIPTCPGQSDGLITVEYVVGGTGVYEYSIDSVNWYTNSTFNVAADTFMVYVRDVDCKTNVYWQERIVENVPHEISIIEDIWTPAEGNVYSDTLVCNGELGQINVTVDSWSRNGDADGPFGDDVNYEFYRNIRMYYTTDESEVYVSGEELTRYRLGPPQYDPEIGENVPWRAWGATVPAGTYYIWAVDTLGCTVDTGILGNQDYLTYVLKETDSLDLNINVIEDAACAGSNDGVIELIKSGGNDDEEAFLYGVTETYAQALLIDPSSMLDWPADTDTTYIQVSSEVGFAIIYDETCGKRVIEEIPIMGYPPLELSDTLEVTDVVCFGAETGSIVMAPATGGSGNVLTYTLYEGGMTAADTVEGYVDVLAPEFMMLPAGDYFVKVNDVECGDVWSELIEIEQPDLTFTIDTFDITCAGNADGLLVLYMKGAGNNAPYFKLGSANWREFDTHVGDTMWTKNVVITEPGDYKVYAIDSVGYEAGCDGEGIEFTIEEPPVLTVELEGVDTTACSIADDGYVVVTIDGGKPTVDSFEVQLVGVDTVLIPRDSVHTFTGVESGDYEVVVTEVDSGLMSPCVLMDSVSVTPPDEIVIDVVDYTAMLACKDDSTGIIEVDITGGSDVYRVMLHTVMTDTTYVDTVELNANNQITDLPAGMYIVEAQDSVQIYDTICVAMTDTLTIGEPGEYLMLGATKIADMTCLDSASFSLQASGGTPGYRYYAALSEFPEHILLPDPMSDMWQEDSIFVVGEAGTWVVWVIDEAGCIVGGEFDKDGNEINEWRVPIFAPDVTVDVAATLADEIACYGEAALVVVEADSVMITKDSDPNYTTGYTVWFENMAGDTLAVNDSLSYVPVSMKDTIYAIVQDTMSGCIGKDTVILTQNAMLSADGLVPGDGSFSCPDVVEGYIEALVSGGTAPYEYQLWQNDTIKTDYQPDYSFLVQVNNKYQFVVKDANGCTDTSEVLILDPVIEASFEVKDVTCFDDTLASAKVYVMGEEGREFTLYWEEIETGKTGMVEGIVTDTVIDQMFEYDEKDVTDRHYDMWVIDSEGCPSDTTELTFKRVDGPLQVVNVVETPAECQTTFGFEIAGGTAPYAVWVDTMLVADSIDFYEQIMLDLPGGEHTVYVVDAQECTLEYEFDLSYSTERMDTVQIYEGDTAHYVDAEADLDTMLVGGVYEFVYDSSSDSSDCKSLLTVTVIENERVAPVVEMLSPTDTLENNKPVLVVTFTDDVTFGEMGYITVTAVGDTMETLKIAITEDMVSGNTITVDYDGSLEGHLDTMTTYIVNVDSDVVWGDGLPWDGIADDTTWTFTTGVDDITTGITNPWEEAEFKVYPNPFNNFIRIDNHDKLDRVIVSNIAGQRVLDIEYPSYEIRTGNLVTGVYVVTLISNDEIVKSERIIKR